MFRYQTSYRFYTLAKVGFALAYLWYVRDFFRIHVAVWNQSSSLLSDPSNISFSGNPSLDVYLRRVAVFLSGKMLVWMFLLVSPLAAGLYLWGRRKWLQFAVGGWMSFSMISLTALVGVFNSAADIWVNYVFISYNLTALICPTEDWDRSEPGLSPARWRDNPVLTSTYAWLVVFLQFIVYFFAGVNKLVYGWIPWTTGIALQNLAFDSSMHDFVREIHVPYLVSLALCYVTLFQRLVVPFGFFIRRFRIWSVLILGAMHVGYAILMNVNLFPLIGIASLLVILPPRTLVLPQPPSKQPRGVKRRLVSADHRAAWIPHVIISIFSLWLLLESARLTIGPPTPWENKLMIVPAWRMFADGGVTAGDKWRIILETPRGEVDATDIAHGLLPHLWRDRFYVDDILHEILNGNTRPGSLPDRLITATEKAYGDHQRLMNANPVVLSSGFDIYRREPPSTNGSQ